MAESKGEGSLELAALAADRAAIGILCLARDGRVVYANQHVCHKLGYSRDELSTLHIWDLNPVLTPDVWPAHSRRFVGAATPTTFETFHRSRQGSTIPVEVTVSCVERGGEALFLASIRDLTEQKLAAAERDRLSVELSGAHKLESLGRLAGGVAHDFNNMLSVIQMSSQLVLDKLPTDSPLRGDVENIRFAASRSAALTRQLLTFARKQPIAPRRVDLSEVTDGFIKVLGRAVGDGIELKLSLSDEPCPVYMDPVQIEQLVANLVLNARDAVEAAGTIVVTTRCVPADDEALQRQQVPEGDWIALEIADSGPGIPLEARDRLFEPFFTTKPLGRGTGLGLATVFGIVSQNHGVVRVESEARKGATFFVYLPRARAPELAALELPSTRQEPRGTETILVVEDEPAVLRLTATLIETLGYSVIPVSSAQAALDVLAERANAVDLVLTDVVMPQMSGPVLARQVRERWPGVPLVYMSGHAADAGLELQPEDAFLQKPMARHELAQALRAALDRRRRREV